MVDLPTILPKNFDPLSRVWVYQANRTFTMGEIFELEPLLEDFVANWKSHGAKVKGMPRCYMVNSSLSWQTRPQPQLADVVQIVQYM